MIPYMPGNAQGDGSEAATFYFDDIVQTEPAAATCDDGIQNGDETGIDCGGTCNACPEIKLPLDFSSADQLFTHDDAGNGGGSVVMDGGQMRFNGNGQAYDQAYLDLTTSFSLMDNANNTFTGALGNAGYLKSNGDLQVAPGNLLSTTFLKKYLLNLVRKYARMPRLERFFLVDVLCAA
jgi:hypothetical protein